MRRVGFLLTTATAAVGAMVVLTAIPAIGGAASTAHVASAPSSRHPIVVTGTVNARQSGRWTVGIAGTATVALTGTPSVLVANFPADQKVSGTVAIGNLPATLSQLSFDSHGNLKTTPQGTQNVSVANTVTTTADIPSTAFGPSAAVGPGNAVSQLPKGGTWAITSYSLSNNDTVSHTGQVGYYDCSNSSSNVGSGPIFTVQPGETVQFAFPQPWTIPNPLFGNGCLTIFPSSGSIGNQSISIVGYTY